MIVVLVKKKFMYTVNSAKGRWAQRKGLRGRSRYKKGIFSPSSGFLQNENPSLTEISQKLGVKKVGDALIDDGALIGEFTVFNILTVVSEGNLFCKANEGSISWNNCTHFKSQDYYPCAIKIFLSDSL